MRTNYHQETEMLRLQYVDSAKEAQEHRSLGHNMSISPLTALVTKGDIVSLDCECGSSFSMPFVKVDV